MKWLVLGSCRNSDLREEDTTKSQRKLWKRSSLSSAYLPHVSARRRTSQDNANVVQSYTSAVPTHAIHDADPMLIRLCLVTKIIPDDTQSDVPNRSEACFGLSFGSWTKRNFVPGRCFRHLDMDESTDLQSISKNNVCLFSKFIFQR